MLQLATNVTALLIICLSSTTVAAPHGVPWVPAVPHYHPEVTSSSIWRPSRLSLDASSPTSEQRFAVGEASSPTSRGVSLDSDMYSDSLGCLLHSLLSAPYSSLQQQQLRQLQLLPKRRQLLYLCRLQQECRRKEQETRRRQQEQLNSNMYRREQRAHRRLYIEHGEKGGQLVPVNDRGSVETSVHVTDPRDFPPKTPYEIMGARAKKKSPSCMRRCMMQGLLHPAQCHSLC